MNILDMLYTLIIGPLKLLFEVIYTISYYITNSAGLSIIVLSLVMNVLLLPLYSRADKIQEEENEIEKKLKPGVDHIKKTFKGDERYMILQTYYRQNNYKQTNVLKGSISLLLEIPFFIAAYDFLSNLGVIKGASFLLISNLAKPDGLLNGINILPILMTLINIVSSIIYTKGQPLKSKIQLYLMALLFLVLLYDRPSALVFYWTLNNIFSLLKNIYIKYVNNKKIIYILLSLISVGGIIYVLINPFGTTLKQIAVIVMLICFNTPLIISKINISLKIINSLAVDNKKYLILTILFTVLVGSLIPLGVIVSSPSEFIDIRTLVNPLNFVLYSLLLSSGIFIVWFNVFYALLNRKYKAILCFIISILFVVSIINYLFFGTNLGTLSNSLMFDNDLVFSNYELIINIIVDIIIIIIFAKINIKRSFLLIALATMIIISSINCVKINNEYHYSKESITQQSNDIASLSFSKSGKNVLVIMLDRAISSYLPYMFYENKDLIKKFEGFIYYPNTTAFGSHTIFSAPAIYGGYEYTPYEINKRNNESLQSKHDEALKVLPVLFNNNGFNVTIFDPPLAGYKDIPDLSIFNEYQNIKAYNTVYGMFKTDIGNTENMTNRNFVCYSIMKIAPLFLQRYIYNYGSYNSINYYNTVFSESFSIQGRVKEKFVNNYAVLDNLINISDSNSEKDSLIMIANEATHEYTVLEEPTYTPKYNVDNTEYDLMNKDRYSIFGDYINFEDRHQYKHYHVNMASFIKLGEWFDYLKEIGVYDNTRIIVVSDHGYSLKQFDDMLINKGQEEIDIMCYNAMLLYKDFNSSGEFEISNNFMTIADVPTLVTGDIISNPVNPFTNNSINSEKKKDDYQYVIVTDEFGFDKNTGNSFEYYYWLKIYDDIFNENNWEIENKQ